MRAIRVPASCSTPWLSRAVAAGVLVWLAVAVVVRLEGHLLLLSGSPILTLMQFGAAGIATLLVGVFLHSWLGIEAQNARSAALAFIAPGLLIDGAALLAFAQVFPNVKPSRVSQYGALSLWTYGWLLAAAGSEAKAARVAFDDPTFASRKDRP